MSDLNAFFAKKKDKKKKTFVKLDDVGNMLEKKAQKLEEREREESEELKNGEEERSQEESEWLDYDSNTHTRVEGLRIKDMAVEDTEEEVGEATEEKETEKEAAKTWGTVEKKEPAPEIIPSAAEYAASKPTRYVPPSLRGWNTQGSTGGSSRIDINNQEMFPTFAAAEQIEKHKKEETTTKGWTTAGAPKTESKPGTYQAPKGDPWGSARSNRDREDVLAAARAMGAQASPAPIRPPAPAEPELKKSANAYVPPHLRNKT